MITERYLLDELTPDVREAYEEHLFDCPVCSFDLRAGTAFIDEAKVQFPKLASVLSAPVHPFPHRPEAKRTWWKGWLQPAFAAPVFVTLLLIIGYQNLVLYPQLRAEASQPRLLPWAPLRGDVRGGPSLAITADHRHGVALPVDLPPQPSAGAYSSYAFDLYDPQGKLAWTGLAAATGNAGDGQRVSLVIPGAMLREGAYTVAVSGLAAPGLAAPGLAAPGLGAPGIAAQGDRAPIGQYLFRIHLTN